jgi:predicted ester cyclase
MSIEENIKLVRRAFEAFNTGDMSKVFEFISDDYTNREVTGAKDSYRSKLRGPEEFIDSIKNLRSAFPDLHYEESEISQGNKVVFVGNVAGTHKGNFFFIPPTGNKISYEAVHIHTIGKDGKIVEHKA